MTSTRAASRRKRDQGKKDVPAPAPAPATPRVPARARAGEVKFTNLDRVMFPAKGYTKGDVLEYYLKVAPKLLPHLRDRPITLERLPEGVGTGAPHFWQKNTPS